MNEPYDVVVIGAGIVGTSTALHLIKQGKKTLLIDRREPGQETSFGNAGILGDSYMLPFSFPKWQHVLKILLDQDTSARIQYASIPNYLPWLIKFYFQSQPKKNERNGRLMRPLLASTAEEHRTLMQGTDAERYLCKTGRVVLYRSEASFQAAFPERVLAKEYGVPFEVMNSEAFREIEPDLKPNYHKAVRWLSSYRLNNPGALVKAYAKKFVAEGGGFLETDARQLTRLSNDQWCIETIKGDIGASNVVLSTGPWANELLESLGYSFPLALKRGYHQHFNALADAKLSHVITDADNGYALAPMESGYRLTTGIEFAARDAVPTPLQLGRIIPFARELFPLGDPLEQNTWCGSRPCFTDSLPVIGPAPRHDGLWFNFGQGHLGMTAGPSSGRLMAEMIMGSDTFCDPHPYRAERFAC